MRISFANGTRRLFILPIANQSGTNSRLWNERQIRAFCQEAPTEKLAGLKIWMSPCPAAGGNQWVLRIINQLVYFKLSVNSTLSDCRAGWIKVYCIMWLKLKFCCWKCDGCGMEGILKLFLYILILFDTSLILLNSHLAVNCYLLPVRSKIFKILLHARFTYGWCWCPSCWFVIKLCCCQCFYWVTFE